MDASVSVIPARSEKQAMDWSVVLLSQGIESSVQHDAETARWNLMVDGANYTRSLQILRLYITENRKPIWVQKLPWSQLVFDWRSTVWFALLVVLFAMAQNGFASLDREGVMSNQAVREGEWWRLCTATMLHADLPHLLSNVAIGILFLGLAMAIYGPGLALFAAFLSGMAGNIAGLLLYPHPYYGRGASGMVMGALGLLAAHTLMLIREKHPDRRLLVRSAMAACLLLVLVGFDPASDVVAHVGGFVAGVGFGALISVGIKSPSEKPVLSTGCGLTCGALAACVWYLALRS